MACRNEGLKGRVSPRKKEWDDYPPPKPDPETGCLRWQGSHSPSGYGRMGRRYAHREAWLRAGGTIPPGMTVDHVHSRGCRHRDCVNVAHLEIVTQKENVRRGQKVAAQLAAKHCPAGHPYYGDNLIVRRGKRECRSCGRERNRIAYQKRKAAGRT